jgi:hypothetical protein
MALYTIIRVYEVPADTQQQATDRMIEALALHVERDYHVKDVIRVPGATSAMLGEVAVQGPPPLGSALQEQTPMHTSHWVPDDGSQNWQWDLLDLPVVEADQFLRCLVGLDAAHLHLLLERALELRR